MGLRGPKPRRREVVWNSELAYGIGLIASDGSLSRTGRHIVFVSTDKELPEYVQKCFDVKAKIVYKYSSPKNKIGLHYRLQWGDVTLYNFFLSIGLTSNKSLTISQLKIPEKYFLDFLRGVFDGDGSFYSYFDPRWKSSFMYYLAFASGSRAYLDWLQNRIFHIAGIKGHISDSAKRRCLQLRYAKREGLILMKYMYSNEKGMYLKRKRLKIEAALRIVGESL